MLKNWEKRKMNKDHIEKHVRNQISKFDIPFNIEEAQRSNILISGTNHTGKSRLASNVTSILQNFSWKIVCFDNTGVWREISDLPIWCQVTEQDVNLAYETVNYPFPKSSMIYDTSLLIPDQQKLFVDKVLRDLWDARVNNPSNQWTLVALEEAQLFMRNIRGSVSQNLLRIASAGRNLNVRILAITVDLALVDPSFIRLCQQRYHARLAIEDNSKRKFRGYYGGDWCRIAQELDLGFFIYLFKNKLKIVHVPLFEPKRLPAPYTPPTVELPKPKGLWQLVKEFFFGTSKHRKIGRQNEALRVLW
jgi:hypothetical protein